MKKNGFTLVEVLAVIVILGVILAIVVTNVRSVIQRSTEKGMESHAYMVLDSLKTYSLTEDNFDITDFNIDNLAAFELNADNYDAISATIVNGKIRIYIKGKGKLDGFIACGTRNDITVVPETDLITCTP